MATLGFITPVFFLVLICRLPAQTNAAIQVTSPRSSQAAGNDIVVRLAKACSIEEVDRVLMQLTAGKPKSGNFEWLLDPLEEHGSWSEQLLVSFYRIFEESADPPGQVKVESLLAGWGKHGSWYDLAVMRYVWKFWPRVFHQNQIDPMRLIPILRQRVKEQPKLSGQLFWYAQWEHRGMKFKEICDVSRSPLLVDNSCGGAEFPAILFIAGAMGQPWLLQAGGTIGGDPTADQLCDWWIMTGYLYFQSIRPFVRYDTRRHLYVYDKAADRENRYLKPDEQEPVCPSTPLPDWDSKIMPEPPPREK
jgi:hypothetical protein